MARAKEKCLHDIINLLDGSTFERDESDLNPVLRCSVCRMTVYIKPRKQEDDE